MRPDQALREPIDGAMEKLRADGTVAKIYGRYGVALQAPK
jgi:polar amino acid transport system substrate-binding protein